MKFEEVLPALKAGKKIRRKDWLSDGYIKMSSLRYFGEIVDEYYKEYGLTMADLTEDDWEILEEN